MFRSPLGRNLAVSTRATRRLVLVLGLFVVAACVPFINAGAWGQEEEVQPRKSQATPKGEANIIAGAEFVPGEVLVRFRTDTAAKSAEVAPMSLRAEAGGGDVTFQRFDGSDIVDGLRLAKVDAARTLEAVAELANRSDVLYAEPNYIWRATRTPNDPRYTNGEQYGLNRINAPVAWNTTIGSRSVVVGVLDGGVNIAHEDLRDNLWVNPGEVPNNNFDDDGNGFADDVNGWDFDHDDKTIYDGEDGDDHATHVAGTIGAEGDNATGVTGVNWEVSIMSLKVLGPDGGSVSNIIDGYSYAIQMRQRGVNLRVLNNSYGGPGKSLAAQSAIQQLSNAGILFVAAAGNGGGDGIGDDNFSFPDFPSNYNVANVIAVAATNSGDGLSSFSNFSSRLVSIGAPGSNILSTVPAFVNASGYEYFGGTSMAAPHVAGTAALVLSVKPDIPLANLRGVLAFTGDRVAALDGKTTTGRRLNAANAVAAALENDTDSPGFMFNFRIISQTGRSVTLGWTAPPENLNAASGTCSDYDFSYREGSFVVALPVTVQPAAPGTQQTVTVNVPYNHFSGSIEIRVYDNVGNSNGSSATVNVPVNTGSSPYVVGQSGAQSLTAPASSSIMTGDDLYSFQSLPFAFPFYGVNRTNVTVSTNGVLYFSTPPRRPNGDADDVPSSIDGLQGQTMIAGLWDDIDINPTLRSGSGVFVTQPGGGRILFRWRGVTFSTPRGNVDFEIELRNDGTIITRYGENTNLFPIVGISGGEPSAYVIDSHTRDRTLQIGSAINLTNAPTVTFQPRVPSFTVSGRVADGSGFSLSGVTVTLSGSLSATTTTDIGGNYSFTNLTSGGSYGFTPSKAGYTFTPPGFSLFNLTTDATVNFTGAINNPAGPNSVGLAQASYQHTEGDGRATFTVTRSGDTSGTATVDYRTVDTDTFTVGCADAVNNNGGAFARCDFATTSGSLSFAENQLSRTITVPLIDDGHDEGTETFQLQLSNATGSNTTLGAQNVSTVTLLDNDTGIVANPIVTLSPSDYPFFVRQQYLDFLSREPEANEPWTAVMNRCPNVNTGPAVNTDCDRIAVSRAFFESPEFNLKGFYAFRFYKVAFNRLPQYTEIVSDMSFLAGATEAEVYARRAQLATSFVARQEFTNAYGGLSNAQFVSTLLGRYSLASITTPDPLTPDSGTRVTLSSSDLTARLDANLLTRAQVFRAISDSDQVYAIEFNSAFVAVQYYGYLRRTPEEAGYQANLSALQRGTSRREMINGFLNSTEYRLRFGQP